MPELACKFNLISEEAMLARRDRSLKQLARKEWNGQIKIVTGIRRCGKSTLLFEIFYKHLLDQGIAPGNVVRLALDEDRNEKYRDPSALAAFVRSRCADPGQKYFVLLDEVQFAITKDELRDRDRPVRLYGALNEFLHARNIDVYVTGSNSKLLSKDVSTEFRGRGDVIHVGPLTFAEYSEAAGSDRFSAYDEYSVYGGMPRLLSIKTEEEKTDYLKGLFDEIYFKDIEDRYAIKLPGILHGMTSSLCSSIGSLTNANKLANAVSSVTGRKVDSETVGQYLSYLTDSFLFSKADRYDVKGKRYFEYPSKYYCTDVGLRNAYLGFRQLEPTHIMENLVYNELKARGFSVDVGVVGAFETNSLGKRTKKSLEIDFIASKGIHKYYIQSAYAMADDEKQRVELRPLLLTEDSFKKVVVSRSYGKSWIDDNGILRLGLMDFLLDEDSLDR